MAQAGYTPIQLYYSNTATNAPASLANGEVAINQADGKLYYRNNSGAVTLFTVASTGVTTVSFGSTGLTPNTATNGAVTVAGTLAVANGGTNRTVGNYSIYANEIHVGKDGNDTTGDGTLINPVLTITKALTLISAGRNTVIVHPGSYSESPTVSSTNTTIETTELTGANTQISGTLTTSAAARISGLKITNLTITGSGNTYISNCTVDTRLIKSGSNYVEIINSELQCTLGVQISGAGAVSILGNKNWSVAVSNASANVLIKDAIQVLTPSVTAGTLNIDGCAVFASSPASNAITSGTGSFITLANSYVLNSAGTSVERISLAGSYSILNLVYDKTNSTFTGSTNLNAIDYFSVINADTLSLTNALAANYGGTGFSTYATGDLIYASAANTLSKLTAGTNGFVLTLAAGVPSWAAAPATGVTSFSAGTTGFTPSTGTTGAVTLAGTLANTNGGTGQSSAFTQYGVTYASTTTALATTSAGTTTTVLHGNAAGAPTFGAVSLTADVSGTLGAANGGTGVANNSASTITISGNFASTFVVSGANSYTLPNASDTLVNLGSTQTLTSKTLTNPTVTNYVESVVAIGNSGTSQTLSLTNGTVQTVTMTGNCTFTMPTATAGKSFILIISTGAGSFTGTFTSVKWPINTPPTLTTTASRWDIITFVADGTNWYGSFTQGYA
jgi:hypothetical protein